MATPYSYLTHLECSKTGHRHNAFAPQNLSNEKHPLLARYDLEAAAETFTPAAIRDRPFDLWRYHEVLPIQEERHCLKLGEGGTPLHPAPTLGTELGIRELLIKDEGMNPTGSFKDRGLCLAVSAAYQFDALGIALPSAGNAGGAAAAYAARAGMQCVVAVPGDCPEVNRIEASVYGAEVHSIDGLISDAGRMIAELAPGRGLFEVATLKEPYRIEGKKTMGYEVFEQLGRLPDVILYPTGGGTGLIGMWKAFDEMEQLGWIGSERPRMVSVQSEGCAPIPKAFEEGTEASEMWQNARTVASGLRVPKALGDFLILAAVRESGGTAIAVSDEELMRDARRIGAAEGIFAAPEGGACLSALRRLRESGDVAEDDTVVLFNTGTGAKYVEAFLGPGAAAQHAEL
ncbi:MAG: threonine synthase [Acidobacteria bacterium]|nr:threonine synthase [Acidobacteriota bacterium]MYG75524.1 threonine synthase [Acidobacteriota bacterium]